MKSIAVIFTSIAGAILGFLGGLLLAFAIGLHERTHVFVYATLGAAIAAFITAKIIAYVFTRFPKFRTPIVSISVVSATGLYVWFLHLF